ncbi:MAG TPA: precorrin-8X methylmutase [Hyphomicrobiaceae bacterium]|nr:precorrin-8X methylmutase [Hyphomicrobiaceae bacterium]
MLTYLREPAEIYRQSFLRIRQETDLSGFEGQEEEIAVRVVHACGMPDVVKDLRFHGDVAGAALEAMSRRRPVFVDAEMVRAAVLHRALPPGVTVRCSLNDDSVRDIATNAGTTRSAAAVGLWGPDLEGSIVVIGNAPTALFALLDAIDAGGPRPAAIFAFPVGFVGAAECKSELAANPRGLCLATLLGRRGGSAIAGAALNAVLVGARDA